MQPMAVLEDLHEVTSLEVFLFLCQYEMVVFSKWQGRRYSCPTRYVRMRLSTLNSVPL